MADQMAVLRDGIVMQQGAPRHIYTRPADGFVANFIGETNLFPGLLAADRSSVETPHGIFRSDRCAPDGVSGDATCSIRPETISVAPPDGSPTGGSLEGVVESVVYLGDTEQYLVSLNDGSTVRCVEWNPSEPRAHTGERVTLSFRAEDVVILPADRA